MNWKQIKPLSYALTRWFVQQMCAMGLCKERSRNVLLAYFKPIARIVTGRLAQKRNRRLYHSVSHFIVPCHGLVASSRNAHLEPNPLGCHKLVYVQMAVVLALSQKIINRHGDQRDQTSLVAQTVAQRINQILNSLNQRAVVRALREYEGIRKSLRDHNSGSGVP